ncbi:MAG: carboxymuconolactone decarboxylase family protein [Methanobrevibacter sp.]|jgi:4-carboxymuconolactone decarboxylase|nr:carboxymuconolactone decarboxylase family protein [Candidatus Methanoflexus mossambicus]
MEDRFEKGMKVLNISNKDNITKIFKNLEDIAPDLAKWVVEFPYSEIYTRDGLDLKTRELITVGALTAMGTAPGQLKSHINAALNVGNSPKEIVEAIIQMSAYAGFPAALNGIMIAKELFEEKDLLPIE